MKVSTVLRQLSTGTAIGEILAAYPSLEREDILQALRYAAWRVGGTGRGCQWRIVVFPRANVGSLAGKFRRTALFRPGPRKLQLTRISGAAYRATVHSFILKSV